MQEAAPAALAKYPAGQGVHPAAPATLAKDPAGQDVHAAAPSGAKDPGGQVLQLVSLVTLQARRGAEPAEHVLHAEQVGLDDEDE